MDFVTEFLFNYYFLTFTAAWVFATIIKAGLHSISHGLKFNLSYGMQNGGMPSGHTTVVSALTFSIFFKEGGFSDLFFISAIFASIVIVDAVRVRRNIGIQGDKLNELLKEFNEKPIKVVYGHSIMQVLAGLLLGFAIALVFYNLMF